MIDADAQTRQRAQQRINGRMHSDSTVWRPARRRDGGDRRAHTDGDGCEQCSGRDGARIAAEGIEATMRRDGTRAGGQDRADTGASISTATRMRKRTAITRRRRTPSCDESAGQRAHRTHLAFFAFFAGFFFGAASSSLPGADSDASAYFCFDQAPSTAGRDAPWPTCSPVRATRAAPAPRRRSMPPSWPSSPSWLSAAEA